MRAAVAVAFAVPVAVAVVCTCACAPAAPRPPASPAPPAPVETASCAAPPPHALPEDAVDASGEFDGDLAALDLESLPATINAAALNPIERDMVAYMLETPADTLTSVDRDAAASTLLGEAVLGAFASGGGTDFDLPFLRRGLFARYACARGQPVHLADFIAGFEASNVDVVDSVPKATQRRISEGLRGDVDVYIGETLEADGSVRETEALVVGARNDAAVDFFAYDKDGELTRSSTFAAGGGTSEVTAPVPFTCMACHRDKTGNTGFTVLHP